VYVQYLRVVETRVPGAPFPAKCWVRSLTGGLARSTTVRAVRPYTRLDVRELAAARGFADDMQI